MKVTIQTDPLAKQYTEMAEVRNNSWFTFDGGGDNIYVRLGGHRIYRVTDQGIVQHTENYVSFKKLRYVDLKEVLAQYS